MGADALAVGVGATGRTRRPHYRDVVAEVRAELLASVDAAVAAGVDPAKLIIDPGLGFAKTATTQLGAAARAAASWSRTGIPVLVGASRKRFLGTLLAGADGAPRPPDGRETATAVISALAALHGAWGVRVHDVRAIGRCAQGRRGLDASARNWLETMADRIELRGLTVRGQPRGVRPRARRRSGLRRRHHGVDRPRRRRGQRRTGRHLDYGALAQRAADIVAGPAAT